MFLRLTEEGQRELAGKLPKGRAFASGKAFVPFVNRTFHAQLAALGGEEPAVKSEGAARAARSSSDTPKAESGGAPSPVALSWASITVGSVVLASEGPMEGWYEAVVTAAKPDHLFKLKWRDWPDEPAFVRTRGRLGLLPPDEAAKAGSKKPGQGP